MNFFRFAEWPGIQMIDRKKPRQFGFSGIGLSHNLCLFPERLIYGYRTEEGVVEFLRVTTEKGVLIFS